MFDIGFFELLVIAVVALVVIGPEQLPGALRTAGLWIGRIKRGLAQTRREIEQQIGADDIRRQLHNEEVMRRLNATEEDIRRVLEEKEEDFSAYFAPEHHQNTPPEERAEQPEDVEQLAKIQLPLSDKIADSQDTATTKDQPEKP